LRRDERSEQNCIFCVSGWRRELREDIYRVIGAVCSASWFDKLTMRLSRGINDGWVDIVEPFILSLHPEPVEGRRRRAMT
jgi:hypothetical protein